MSASVLTESEPITLDWLALTPGRDSAHRRYTDRLQASVPRVTRRIGAHAGGETARLLDDWREVFLALPDDAAHEAVSHPLFNYYWLQLMDGCLRGDRGFLQEWAHHFARFVVVPAMRNGIPVPAPLAVRKGGRELRLPGHRNRVLFDRDVESVEFAAEGEAWIRNGSAQVSLRFLDDGIDERQAAHCGLTTVACHVIDGTDIEIDAGDPWIGRLLADMNTKPPQPGYPAPDLVPMVDLDDVRRRDIGGAFQLIEHVWPQLASEIRAYVRLFVPYRSAYHSSFTEACMMGAVFLSEAMWPFSDVIFTAEHLLHEEAHLRLTLIEEIDPIVTPVETVAYASPWRRDPRPLSGLLQAAFAFARIAAFHRIAYEATGDLRHERRRVEVVDLLTRGMNEVEAGPELDFTATGAALWAEMRAEAAQ